MRQLLKKLKRMSGFIKHDRSAQAIIIAAVVIFCMGSLRPDKPTGMYPKQYWAVKVGWEHCADAVIAGDSRVLMAVSTDELGRVLEGMRIYNYGFGGNWYSEEYLKATRRVLDPNSDNKTVFFGISPHSLTDRTDVVGHFLELSEVTGDNRFLSIYFSGLIDFFEPMSFRDAFHGLFPSLAPTHTSKHYEENGWIAVHKYPEKRNEIERYQKLYDEQQVSEKIIQNVLDFTRKWTSSGIKVYGFIPPSCPEMVKLEDQLSGFDEEKFVQDFREAGGTWIEVDLGAYATFDGSHLQDFAAVEFTRDFSENLTTVRQLARDTAANGGKDSRN